MNRILIEKKKSILRLIKEAESTFASTGKSLLDIEDYVAEYLAAKGVIAPICKVGDKVFIPDRFGRIEAEIESIEITQRGLIYEWVKYDRGVDETEVWDDGSFVDSDIGKTVFLNFQEYEKAFAERIADDEQS